MSWKPLGSPPPKELVDARLSVHWAAQAIAAAGAVHVEERDDDSHRNLGWSAEHQALLGHPGSTGLSVGIHPGSLALLVVADNDTVVDRRELAGSTLDASFSWLAETLHSHGAPARKLERPTYDLPDHPVAGDGTFAAPGPAHEEVARWYHNAALALEDVRGDHAGASDVRCWPHHFDIATLITVQAGDDPEHSRTVGVGMTPGDAGIAEPYWYVTPWPYPQDPMLPDLPHGAWNTEGWVGAVLTGTQTVGSGESPAETVRSFLDAAIGASRTLIQEES